jgi:hypothetical protein
VSYVLCPDRSSRASVGFTVRANARRRPVAEDAPGSARRGSTPKAVSSTSSVLRRIASSTADVREPLSTLHREVKCRVRGGEPCTMPAHGATRNPRKSSNRHLLAAGSVESTITQPNVAGESGRNRYDSFKLSEVNKPGAGEFSGRAMRTPSRRDSSGF